MQIQHPDLQIIAACRDSSKLLPHYSGEVRQGDLRDPDYLDRVLAGIDIICHAAGWSSFENSGDICNEAYLEPTLDLINHAIEWRVSRFINLSSLYVTPVAQRNNSIAAGRPRAYWPMINCLIAVEDYLSNYHGSRCQFVNLRLGLYSGKRLNMGLLPLLLSRSDNSLFPYINGKLGYFPLLDGKDIGQAFVRAALAPIDGDYSCINIVGPQVPTQSEVVDFIAQQISIKLLWPGLPSFLASSLLWLPGKLSRFKEQPQITPAILDIMKSPVTDSQQARTLLGYDPEVSWQASLLDTLELYKNQSLNTDITQPVRALNI